MSPGALSDLATRIAALEAKSRQIVTPAVTNVTTAAATVSVPKLTILTTPVTLASGAGVIAWTTQALNSWPSNATHVYVEAVINMNNASQGLFQVRTTSAAGGYSVVGILSAGIIGGNTGGCAFAQLSKTSTFDYQNTSGDSWVLRLICYIA